MKKLPASWENASLMDLLDQLEDGRKLHQGWSPQCEKGPAEDEATWAVLKTTAIQNGSFLPEHNKSLPKNLVPRPLLEVHTGDILLTCAGPRDRCGVPCLVRKTRPRLMISGKMYRFRAKHQQIEPRYLEIALRSHSSQRTIDAMKTGMSESGMNLTQEKFRKLQIPLAPMNEQIRISNKLDTLESLAISCTAFINRAKQLLEFFYQNILSHATSGDLTSDWRTQKGIPFKKSSFNFGNTSSFQEYFFPSTWMPMRLSEIAEIASGVTKDSKKQNANDKEVAYLRVANVQRGYLDLSEVKTIRIPAHKLKNVLLKKGDVLFNEGGDIDKLGRGWVWNGELKECTFQNHVFRVRLHNQNYSSMFFSWYGNSRGYNYFLENGKQTTNLASINKSVLSNLPIVVPPIEEQQEIERRVRQLFGFGKTIENHIEEALVKLEKIFPSLISHALLGKLSTQDPLDESASSLLRKIKSETQRAIQTKRTKRPTKNLRMETPMLTRTSVANTPHLSKILKERGPLTSESLWSASSLEIDDFYDQLKEEEERGLLKEKKGVGPLFTRLLEAKK